jgi:hypothetical protein
MAATRQRSLGCASKATLQKLHRRGGSNMLMAKHSMTAASGLQ